MHTFEWVNRNPHPMPDDICPVGDKVHIHHNGDYSGDAIVSVSQEMWRRINQEVEFDIGNGRVEFKIPANLLASFGQRATCDRIVGLIENME